VVPCAFIAFCLSRDAVHSWAVKKLCTSSKAAPLRTWVVFGGASVHRSKERRDTVPPKESMELIGMVLATSDRSATEMTLFCSSSKFPFTPAFLSLVSFLETVGLAFAFGLVNSACNGEYGGMRCLRIASFECTALFTIDFANSFTATTNSHTAFSEIFMPCACAISRTSGSITIAPGRAEEIACSGASLR
jgi:hypothetical protein